MADFCKKCSIRIFGEDFGEIKAPVGDRLSALCEGCGRVTVDDKGDAVTHESDDVVCR